MDSVYTSNTENVVVVHQRTTIHVSRPTLDDFLTLASSNTKAISLFISEVKDACSEFVTDVCELVGGEEEYSDSEYSDSDYSDSEYSDSDSDCSNSDSEVDSDVENDAESDNELTRKIVANEFESIITNLKNMINSLEQKYLAAKDAFHCSMSKELEGFTTSCTNGTTGM